MKWFKHMTNASSDEALSYIRHEMGPVGYAIYFITLETIALQMDASDKTSLTLHIEKWLETFGVSEKKLREFLQNIEKYSQISESESTLLCFKFNQKMLTLDCPKLLKYRDEHTSRLGSKSRVTPEQLPSDSGATRLDKTRREENRKESTKEKLFVVEEETIFSYPTRGNSKTWNLTKSLFDRYLGDYPGMDVHGELKKALRWVEDSPDRRKTERGMPKFLTSWLNRAANQQRATQPAATPQQTGFLDRVEQQKLKDDLLDLEFRANRIKELSPEQIPIFLDGRQRNRPIRMPEAMRHQDWIDLYVKKTWQRVDSTNRQERTETGLD